jgi:hypothetical protein
MLTKKLNLNRNSVVKSLKSAFIPGLLLSPLLMLNACGTLSLLLGNEKPVDEKSKSYQVNDLSLGNPDWTKLDPSTLAGSPKTLDAPDSSATWVSDVTYLSRKDASVISLNSSCEPGATPTDLRASSEAFFYGIQEVTYRREIGTAVRDIPALETTVRGKFYPDPRNSMMLRTVVFRRGSCIFDFIYLAAPEDFGRDVSTFSSFVTSFRLTAER